MTICRYGVSIQLQPQHGLSMTSFMQRTAAQRHVSLRHMIDCTHSLLHGFMVANMVDCPCHYSFDYVQYLPPLPPPVYSGYCFWALHAVRPSMFYVFIFRPTNINRCGCYCPGASRHSFTGMILTNKQ